MRMPTHGPPFLRPRHTARKTRSAKASHQLRENRGPVASVRQLSPSATRLASPSEKASRIHCVPRSMYPGQKKKRTEHMFCPLLFKKDGGPGRPRTYDNPVMSRGLYQLSYGSSSGKYAPILPVWQEKKQVIQRKCFPSTQKTEATVPVSPPLPRSPSFHALPAEIKKEGTGFATRLNANAVIMKKIPLHPKKQGDEGLPPSPA